MGVALDLTIQVKFKYSEFISFIKPIKNRTITRMLLVSEAVFTTVDITGAIITSMRDRLNSGNEGPDFLLRINIVGIGKLIITGASDLCAGMQREQVRNQRILLMREMIAAQQCVVEYNIAGAWEALPNTVLELQQAELGILEQSRQSMTIYQEYEQGVQPKLNHEIKQLKRGEREALSNLLDI